jgi:hypothetical protein
VETTDGQVRLHSCLVGCAWIINKKHTKTLMAHRRRQLAQLGSATGVYKTLVKYLVGVPEVWLS